VVVALLAGIFAVSMIPTPSEMLFPTHAVPPPGPLPATARQVSVKAADGAVLHGVVIPPATEAKQRILVLGFGGNAWNGADVAAYLHRLYPQVHVVVFHYRGYRPSTGRPSAEALIADAPMVRDLAVKLVKPDVAIAAGFSIGSGVAASLARDGVVDGVILVTPFDSLKAAAADLYPWLPVGLFFNQEIDAAGFLAGSDVPVAILAGERDTLIRPARTQGLRNKVRNLVFDRTIAGAGHNDIYERPEFAVAMQEALGKVTARSPK
jgi:pimeloyl-ACP methyl ester carboxylesterase